MGGKVYAKDCPLRHCEKSFSFSWQSIILSISKDSIVKIFYMQDYGLLRSFHSLAMTEVVKFSLCLIMDLQVWANLLTQMCASALPRNNETYLILSVSICVALLIFLCILYLQ